MTIDHNDPTNDPQAAEHRARVDALLAGKPLEEAAPAPAQVPRATAPVTTDVAIPELLPLEGSAQIAEFGYSPETGHLFLRFHGRGGKPGSLYRYANFGETDYKAFLDAESKGSYFGRNIKPHADRYPCERVIEDGAA